MKKRFNFKKFFLVNKFNVLLILLFFLVSLIPFAYSRYSSTIISSAQIDVAIYVLEPGYQYVDLKLADVLPSSDSYEYSFTISNFNGSQTTDVNLEYDLSIVSTTNLPLTFELVDPTNSNANLITTNTVSADDDGTYFRTIKTAKKTFSYTTNTTYSYKLILHYSNSDLNYEYQSMIDSIRIEINSQQVVGS